MIDTIFNNVEGSGRDANEMRNRGESRQRIVVAACIHPMHSIAGVFSCRAGYPSKSQSAPSAPRTFLLPSIASDAAVVHVAGDDDDDDDRPAFGPRVPIDDLRTYRTATIGNVRRTGCDVVAHLLLLASFPRRKHPRFGRKAGIRHLLG